MGVITIIKPDGSTEYTVRPTHAFMGTCSTAAGTAAKTVTITPAIDNFLEAGVRITVYFSNANTAANPTLSINSGTAKKIYKGSSAITAGLLSIGYHDFIYDGTQWQYVSSYINSNTTYNNLSASNTATGTRYTVLGAGANTAKFLRGDGSWQTPTDTTYTTFTTAAAGLTPASGANTDKFLRGDGSWQTPANTTYTTFTTAVNGLVPKPTAANTAKFLRGDGSWVTPTDIDNKVQQSLSTTENYRPIILGHQHGTAGFTPTEEIDITYVNKSISASPATGKILAGGYIISGAATNAFVKADGTAAVPTNTTYSTFTTAAAGLTPTSPGGTAKYLRADGSWQTPTNTTYTTFTTAVAGLTPASGTNTTKFLRGDGSWQAPANTTYTTFTTAAAGLAPTSPGGTAKYLRADGSWQTPPNDNTTYTTFTTAVNGLVPKPTAANTGKYLRGDGSWVTPPNDNTTYARISASNTATGTSYTVPGAGANTAKFLRGDGSWVTPSNTTYANISATNTTITGSYTVPGAGGSTNCFLRGDGSWQVPANTEYHVLNSNHFDAQEPHVVYGPGHFDHHLFLNGEGSWSIPQDTTYASISASNTTTNASYTVPGAGSNTGYFLRGDGSWSVPANTTYTTFTTAVNGLVPKPTAANTAKFLRGDGSWVAPSNTTYNNLSASNTATGTKYTVLGAGANTFKFLRGDGSWQTPPNDNTTYARISASNTATGTSYTVPGAGSNTAKFLRGDGSWVAPYSTFTTATAGLTPTSPGGTVKYLRADGTWQTPTNTTYAVLSSSSTSNGSYVVNGVGDSDSAAKYFLRGDGKWDTPPLPEITQGYAVGQSKNSEVDTIYYEYSRSNESGTNIQTITFRDKDDTELLATSLVNDQMYHFVFRNGLPSSDKRVVLTDTQTYNQISFLRDETYNHWLQRGQDDFTIFPTHIVISFKKTANGLVYLGPIPVFNMLSTVNTYGGRGHLVPGAGANTDKFLRGDGTWQTVGGGGGTSYPTLSASDHTSGTDYVVNGSGTNTGKFLRGDGTWQTPTNTQYSRISASNTATGASYTVPGAGANTDKFLRGDGTWQTPANTTYANISTTNTDTTGSYTVPGAGANTGYFLRGDGYWQHLPISNKIVKEFECETLANIPYSSAINFVGNGMNEALQSAVRNIHYFASTQEILFKFNGRMGYFYEQRELMIFELLIIFNDIARQSLENIGNEYHITVKFEFTPEDRYSAQDVEIQQIGMSNYNKLEIIEANDNTRTLAYDESTSRLSIRELQGNYLNILTYRLDSHNVSPNPNVTQYSIGTQVSLKQYSMIYHRYSTVGV